MPCLLRGLPHPSPLSASEARRAPVYNGERERPVGAEAADYDQARRAAYFTGRFSSLRAKVRRCMPSRRAASEMLKSVSIRVWWMRSHSRVLIEVERTGS